MCQTKRGFIFTRGHCYSQYSTCFMRGPNMHAGRSTFLVLDNTEISLRFIEFSRCTVAAEVRLFWDGAEVWHDTVVIEWEPLPFNNAVCWLLILQLLLLACCCWLALSSSLLLFISSFNDFSSVDWFWSAVFARASRFESSFDAFWSSSSDE